MRNPTFIDAVDVDCARAHFLQTGADYGFEIVACCFMPDHLHDLIEGLRLDADFCKFVSMFKQRSAFDFKRRRQQRLWQEGYYDHVLRDDEATIGVAAYVLHNPVRAGLCDTITQYPYLESQRYSIEELIDAIQIRPRLDSRP